MANTQPAPVSPPARPKKRQRPEDIIDLDKLSPRALITKRQIRASVYPVSEPTLWRRIKQGKFPEPVENGGMAFWRVGDINAWLDAK